MTENPLGPMSWLLDSSTFIHAMLVERVALVILLRSPLYFPEYVFRFELGANAQKTTRSEANGHVTRERIGVIGLTLSDLDRIASLSAPRRIGLGEIACAVIAERVDGGVLCDDRKAKRWLEGKTHPQSWESIEEVLLAAAAAGHIGEFDLVDLEKLLRQNKYDCHCDLRIEHLQRMINRGR